MGNSNKDNLLRPKKRQIVRIAWVLIVLNILIMLPAWLPGNDHIRDPAIEALLTRPTPEAIGGTIGYCIACCLMSIIALILGRIAWVRHQGVGGKIVAMVAIISIGLSLGTAFLPTSESGKQLVGRLKDQYTTKEVLPVYKYTNTSSTMPDFPEYVSDKHGFAVRFPEEPIVTNVGRKVHYAATVDGEKVVYSVFVTTYSRPLNTDVYLETYLQSRLVLLGDKGKLVRSNKVIFMGHTALDYEYVEYTDSVTKYYKGVKFVKRGGKLTYTISLVCTEETKVIAYAKYNNFIKSFSLRD